MRRVWFRAKRYGWGWTPVTAAGWFVTFVFVLAIAVNVTVFLSRLRNGADPGSATGLFLVRLVVLVGALIAICWRTGERPRWRWGK